MIRSRFFMTSRKTQNIAPNKDCQDINDKCGNDALFFPRDTFHDYALPIFFHKIWHFKIEFIYLQAELKTYMINYVVIKAKP